MNFPQLPQRFSEEEQKLLNEVLQGNKLWPYPIEKGKGYVNLATEALKAYFNVPYVVPTSSGTASIHTALGSLRLPPGCEIIVPPITDAGTISPIIFQNAIPIFADVDPVTSTITADTIRQVITERTRAVIVVHLAGCPVDMNGIVELCKKHQLLLIEDAAQALGATYQGRYLGTFGDVGCFSLNDQKHITCGEGGFITMREEAIYYEAHNFSDKYYDRHGRGVKYHGVGLNYRLSEIDGAMILAQLPKLSEIVKRRRHSGDTLTNMLSTLVGIVPQVPPKDSAHSYFFYMYRFDPLVVQKSRKEMIDFLTQNGIKARAGYVEELLPKTKVFRDKSFFNGPWPAEVVSGTNIDYNKVTLPNAELANSTTISFSFHQGLDEKDISKIFTLIKSSLL